MTHMVSAILLLAVTVSPAGLLLLIRTPPLLPLMSLAALAISAIVDWPRGPCRPIVTALVPTTRTTISVIPMRDNSQA
jgi:hypothetical protein